MGTRFELTEEDPKYKCPKCKKKCDSLADLKAHIEKKHSEKK